MSKLHDNAIRYGDEYQCSTCGKSWSVDDDDVPPCTPVTMGCDSPYQREQHLKAQVAGLKAIIQVNNHRMNIPRDINLNWTPKQWYNHLNISKLRDTINTHE